MQLVKWTHACLQFVDAHTPQWHVIGTSRRNRPKIAVRPRVDQRLPTQLIDDIRNYFRQSTRRDPLGLRDSATNLVAVDEEDVVAEYASVQTQMEYDELTRLRQILQMFCFTGVSQVGEMQTRHAFDTTTTPENGSEQTERIIGDVATIDFSTVFGFHGVDRRFTVTNAILDINRTLGIEAARYALIVQYADVFRMAGPNAPSNHANLSLISGVQTSRGVCLAISRQGAKELIEDKLQEASFEQAPMVLLHAAVARAKTLTICSPSSAMLFALATPGFGTSAFELVIDRQKIMTCEPVPIEPLEVTIDTVYPLPKRATIAQAADPNEMLCSPLHTPSADTYSTFYDVPPTQVAIAADINDLDIDQAGTFQTGTFTPVRGSPEPESDDDNAPPVVLPTKSLNQLFDTVMAIGQSRAKKRKAPDYSATNGYDPERPQMTAVGRLHDARANLQANGSSPKAVEEYDPLRPKLTKSTVPSRTALKKVHF